MNTKAQWGSGAKNEEVAAELDSLQSKKIAVELANKIQKDRQQIIASISKGERKKSGSATSKEKGSEKTKTNINKLDKLRESGVVSDEEFNRAKNRLISSESDTIPYSDKLQELDQLHKTGVLSDADYNKAKKRLSELQKLDELYRDNILTEDEYKKAKNRLLEK